MGVAVAKPSAAALSKVAKPNGDCTFNGLLSRVTFYVTVTSNLYITLLWI